MPGRYISLAQNWCNLYSDVCLCGSAHSSSGCMVGDLGATAAHFTCFMSGIFGADESVLFMETRIRSGSALLLFVDLLCTQFMFNHLDGIKKAMIIDFDAHQVSFYVSLIHTLSILFCPH